MANHDGSYKYLFSHARMVEELLKGFVREEWIEKLDFATLEKVNGSYVTDDLQGRADDIVWRIQWGKDWLYVYILIEFQSTVDSWMAVRIMTYVGLLYQDLIRTNQLSAGRMLPPVLPVVLYNGESEWTAATDISRLSRKSPADSPSIALVYNIFCLPSGTIPMTNSGNRTIWLQRFFAWKTAAARNNF